MLGNPYIASKLLVVKSVCSYGGGDCKSFGSWGQPLWVAVKLTWKFFCLWSVRSLFRIWEL